MNDAFPDHSQSFTLGFEAGMAWARMERREKFAMLAHVENADVDWSPNRLRVIQGGLQA